MRVAVIGGGIAGLTAARRLALEGAAVTLFEATSRLGGLIKPASLGELTIDIGAEAFAVRGGSVERFIRELGLEDALVSPRALGSWGVGAAGSYRLPAGGLLGIPAGPDVAGLEAAIGADGVAAVRAEASLGPDVGADAVSLGDLVRARFGELVLRRLVAPVTRGVYSLDPDEVDHRILAPSLLERLAATGSLGAAVASLRPAATPGALVRGLTGGMRGLVTALIADLGRLGVATRMDAPVAIDLDAPTFVRGEQFDRALVATEGAFRSAAEPHPVPEPVEGTPTHNATTTSSATDSPATDSRTTEPHPAPEPVEGTPTHNTASTSSATDAPVTGSAPIPTEVVALLVDASELDAFPRGTGALVADADVDAKALTHVTAKWPWLAEQTDLHVLRLSYCPRSPGDTMPKTHHLNDEAMKANATADASSILGVDITDVRAMARQTWHIPAPAARLGRQAELARIRETIAATPNLDACGTWVDGTGIATVIPAAEAAAHRLLNLGK